MAILTERQVALLREAPLGHLSTSSASGRPHVIPFCFACDGVSIYSVLDAKPKAAELHKLRRVRNILENPRVAVVLDHYEADWSKLWYLLIHGRAELLESGAEATEAVRILREKYPQYRNMDIDGNPVVKITPQRATGWSGA